MRLIHPSSFLPSIEGCHPDKWAENRNILVKTSTGSAQAEVFEFLCFFARAMKDFISFCTTLSSLSSVRRRSILSISRPSPASKRERMNVLHASLARFVVRVLPRRCLKVYTRDKSIRGLTVVCGHDGKSQGYPTRPCFQGRSRLGKLFLPPSVMHQAQL